MQKTDYPVDIAWSFVKAADDHSGEGGGGVLCVKSVFAATECIEPNYKVIRGRGAIIDGYEDVYFNSLKHHRYTNNTIYSAHV